MKPNNISRLFLDAFGGDSPQQYSASGSGRIVNPDERGKLFSDAFRPRGEMPKPNFSGWSLLPKGARGLSFTEMLERYDGKAVRQWREVTGLGKFYSEKGLSLLNVKKMLKALQLPFRDDRDAGTGVRYLVIDWEKVEEYRQDFVTYSIELL